MNADAERACAIRHSRMILRLDEPAPGCLACGGAFVEALTGVPWRLLPEWMQRRIIELHHLDGRKIDPEWTVPLCRNHHAIVTDRRRDLPVEVQRPRTERERHAARLSGVADWLRLVEEGARSARAVVEEAVVFLLNEEQWR